MTQQTQWNYPSYFQKEPCEVPYLRNLPYHLRNVSHKYNRCAVDKAGSHLILCFHKFVMICCFIYFEDAHAPRCAFYPWLPSRAVYFRIGVSNVRMVARLKPVTHQGLQFYAAQRGDRMEWFHTIFCFPSKFQLWVGFSLHLSASDESLPWLF